MGQAIGTYSHSRIIPETDFKVTPTSPSVYEIPFNSNGVSSSQNTTAPGTMTGRRDPVEPILGNIDLAGDIVGPVDTNALGYILACAFGKPTTTGDATKGYIHVFKPSAKQPSFEIEKDFGNGIVSLSKGCKISKLSFAFGGDGELTYTASVMGCDETLGSTALSSSPTIVKMNRLNNFQAALLIDGEETAISTQVTLDIDFGLDESGYAIGGNGFRSRINEGNLGVSGQLTAFFDDKSFVDKAINSTKTAIQIKLTKGTESLTIDVPEVLFARQTPGIDGATGITQQLNYNGFYASNELNTSVQFTLANSIATYPF